MNGGGGVICFPSTRQSVLNMFRQICGGVILLETTFKLDTYIGVSREVDIFHTSTIADHIVWIANPDHLRY